MNRCALLLLLAPMLLASECQSDDDDSSTLEDDDDTVDDDDTAADEDLDGDGFPASEDCDDQDPTRHPGAPEECDGIDSDCDGAAEEVTTLWEDADDDGFGDEFAATVDVCEPPWPEGFVENADDCDDGDPHVHPLATELCDGIDNDCNGAVDEADVPGLSVTCRVDSDGDAWGGPTESEQCGSCPEGFAFAAGDCDDTDPAINPGALDVEGDGVDSDCDGEDCTYGIFGMTDRLLCSHSGNAVDGFATCTGTLGGDPLTFDDASAFDGIVSMMGQTGQVFAMVGLTDGPSEGVWTTWDGGVPPYLPWADGEPNDSNGDEDCAAIQGDLGFLLNDVPCESFSFSGITVGCAVEVPSDLVAWQGYERASTADGCDVTWATSGEPAVAPPAGCQDCAFVFRVTGSVVASSGGGPSGCSELAQPFEVLYGYGLGASSNRVAWWNRASPPDPTTWEEAPDVQFACDPGGPRCDRFDFAYTDGDVERSVVSRPSR